MATSFIKFNNKGYWIADRFVSLLARYLCETYKKMFYKESWQGQMKDELLLIALGSSSGGKTLYLDKYLDTKEKITVYINWIEETKSQLRKKGEYIFDEEINSFDYFESFFVVWSGNLETRILIGLYDEIINILVGNSGRSPSSKSVLPFYKVD